MTDNDDTPAYYDDNPAVDLSGIRLEAIQADDTVKIVFDGDQVTFLEADLVYLDLRASAADVAKARQLSQAVDAELLSTEECCRRINSADQAAVAAGIAHFRDDLQIEILNVAAARKRDAAFDATQLIASAQSDDIQARPALRPITIYTKAPWHGGPFGAPTATRQPTNLPPRLTAAPTPGSIRFAVLDTGIPNGFDGMHPHLTFTVDNSNKDTDTPIYKSAGGQDLLTDAGHGLFIWDIAYRQVGTLAPAFMPRVTRDQDGLTLSEFQIATRLAALAHDVVQVGGHQLLVNMSFSGTTFDKAAPFGLSAELQNLHDAHLDVLVVAAAGNDGSTAPHWPAAFATVPSLNNVVSVGALDAGSMTVAPFSNRGPWVQCWADGTSLVGAYLPGMVDDPGDPNDEFPVRPGTEPWAIWQGTSFAAPRVAAAIARQAKSSPGQTLRQAFDALLVKHKDAHPTWKTVSGSVVTEAGVSIE